MEVTAADGTIQYTISQEELNSLTLQQRGQFYIIMDLIARNSLEMAKEPNDLRR